MNSGLMKVRGDILDLLDECHDTSVSPISTELETKLQDVVDSIGEGRGQGGDLTPGQKQAMEVSGDLVDDVQFTPESDLSPGQQAARNV